MTVTLEDRIWQRILTFLHQQSDVYVGQEAACRQFIEAVLWMTRSGAQWRLLLECYGKWNSIYQRYNRWSKRGIWQRMQQSFVEFADLENVLIDSITVRVHAYAAGEKRGPRPSPGSQSRRV